MNQVHCVGALIRDARSRVYLQRRSPTRALLPGLWDLVGGHLEPGETPEGALAREIEEETGWRLRRIECVLADWQWAHDGSTRHEIDYLVEVDGDLSSPRLEAGKHDANAWIGPSDVDIAMEGRAPDDRWLRDLVARTARLRLTPRLRLEPGGPHHVDDLWRVHSDPAVAQVYGAWDSEFAHSEARRYGAGWENDGAHKWLAYERDGGALVGRGGLSYADVDGTRRLEIGWALRGASWGRGYATEIGQQGLRYAFDDLAANDVVAFTEIHNGRSRAVMERLGMRYAREFTHESEPFVLYELTRDEWAGAQRR